MIHKIKLTTREIVTIITGLETLTYDVSGTPIQYKLIIKKLRGYLKHE